MAPVPLTIVTDNYDRVQGVKTGKVPVEGCDVTYFHLPPSSSFPRLMRNREFQVCEMSLSTYMLSRSRYDLPYRAIPMIVSRVFAQCSIWVRTDGSVEKPKDLKGKTLGLPNYHFTRGLCVKGMLADEFGVSHTDMKYCFGGVDTAFDHAYMKEFELPDGVEGSAAPPGKTLSQMLLDGEIDAITAARDPQTFLEGHPGVKRLFPDFRNVEREYWERTHVWPIMHVLGIREDVLEKYEWLPINLLDAFELSKQEAIERLHELDALTVTLPWLVAEVEETKALMGEDYWPFGIEPNRPTLDAMTRWSFDQGISSFKWIPEDLFVETTHAWRPVDAGRR